MRTLNDIIPPSRRKEVGQVINPSGREPLNLSTDKPPKFPYITIISVVLVVAASISALFYFSVSKIEVTPSTVSAAVQSSFTSNKSSGSLPFEIFTAQKIASQSVKSSGTKTVNSSASGTITVYNTQAKAQTLIANTRFATSAGLIFRIRSAITVPGGTTVKPGSTTAKVYADKEGGSYNVGPTSFTVPGFAGTPQETMIYARSTSAMTGGASGIVPIIDLALGEQARSSLKTALAPDLLESIKTQIPSGYVLVPGAVSIVYEDLDSTPSSTTGMVEIKEQGTITAIVFRNAALAKEIALSVAGLGYQGEPLTLVSTDNLLLAAVSIPGPDTETFSFTLAGTAPLVYTVDPNRIAAAVAGKTRQAAEVAVSSYPEVKRALIVLRPIWRQTFPQDPASINVVVVSVP
ncbi:MAG: hypothetical protein Q8L30_02705 [bacterium]|nr:hypothetical protein [bacterium]